MERGFEKEFDLRDFLQTNRNVRGLLTTNTTFGHVNLQPTYILCISFFGDLILFGMNLSLNASSIGLELIIE